MSDKSQRPKGKDGILSSLNVAINALNRAEVRSGVAPAKVAFGSASDLLTLIRDSTINEADYVELGLTCADVCGTLDRKMDGRRPDQLSPSVLKAIEQLTTAVGEVQRNIIKRGKRNTISQLFHAKDDKEAISTWRLDLNRILQVFNTELVMNTHQTLSDIQHDVTNVHAPVSDVHNDAPDAGNMVLDVPNTHPVVSEVQSDTKNTRTIVSYIRHDRLKNRKDADGQNQATHSSAPGESLPLLPKNTHGATPNIRHDVSEVHRDVVNTQTMVHDIRDMLKSQEGVGSQPQSTQNSVLGELPPPPPRVFFGRDELTEKIVGLAENHAPIALIGVGGIGKTSIALRVLHHDRIKRQFGDDRRFIRCDLFPASRAHFLRHLSKVIGAGIENPEDLAPLRRYLSSKEMMIVLDNAESILGLQETSAQEIYTDVDELSRFDNICLCITSRISTIPPHCETLSIPTLSMGAACDTFYRIYKHDKQSDLANNILKQLDYHPLSIALLATVAQHNQWDTNRLTREWDKQRTGMLRARHSGSLAATIELSLASPMFQELGLDARGLLEVIAFFPQGVNERNIDWLFPTISDRQNMFDTFCILSLTHRSKGYITMLAPLRDYLHPKDPASSPLLGITKEHYFTRLSTRTHYDFPGFKESQWIISEDVNVEHLLDVFTSIDGDSKDVWDTCGIFMNYLHWHKPQLISLGPKIEALPDDHPSKAQCLKDLAWLLKTVGNLVEHKRLLTYTLKLWREKGRDYAVAQTLCDLSDTNRRMDLIKEGMEQAKEASETFEQLGRTVEQAECLMNLAGLLRDDNQLDAAVEAATHAIDLLPEQGKQSLVCQGHRILGTLYHSGGDTDKAIHHFEVTIGIASSFDLHDELFWAHFEMAKLFSEKGRFDDAQAHLEHARPYTVNYPYHLASASWAQAVLSFRQHRFEEARSEALRALDAFEKFGATGDAEDTRKLVRQIDARRK